MQPKRIAVFVLGFGLALTGCSKSTPPAAATGPTATVTLKDGSTFTGSVTKSDPSNITLQSPTGESRTYPMTQVSNVQYADPATPSAAVPAPQPTPASGFAPASGSSAPPPQPSSMASSRPSAPPPPVAAVRTIPAGTTLEVRNNEPINSQTASSGQTFSAVVARDVVDTDGGVAIPKGSDATLVVKEAVSQGKIQGQSELVLDLGSVSVNGRSYRLETVDIVEKGKQGVGTNKRTGIFAGGGAALGGIIGAVAGGGKGAAIGALSGAAAGTATQAVTRGKGIKVPSETVLSFKLEAPVQIREAR
jgi:hypothetical protein